MGGMCVAHAELAADLVDERMQRGWESNAEGMDAILGASSMLNAPTCGLSLGLLRELDDLAGRDPTIGLSEKELAREAELALERLRDAHGELPDR